MAADQARAGWQGANGPQRGAIWWFAQPNDTWIYLSDASTGQYGLDADDYAQTWNCPRFGQCSTLNVAMNIWYTDIYINRDLFQTLIFDRQVNTIANEMGHGFGLFHHSGTAYLMHPYNTTVQVPHPIDIGNNSECTNSVLFWGIRCIYRWPY